MAISSGDAMSFTSFGSEGKDGPMFANVRPGTLLRGERFRMLDMRQSYYDCTQHDMKRFDFDGRVVSGMTSTQPLISQEKMAFFVPLKMRRPSAPYRLGRVITDSFTSLLFGENRFPQLRVDGDSLSEDFAMTSARVGRLPMTMVRARTIGGSTGSVGISWCFYEGKPRFDVHNPKNIYVHSWKDRTQLVAKHVTEVYPFYRTEWTGREFENVYYWFRRDWTTDADIVFKEARVLKGQEPTWEVDQARSVEHKDGVNHFHWVQNIPSDEVDGFPDYHGLYESFDQLDILCSVVSKGAILNLDPTLKLRMDPDLLDKVGLRKGSDNALVVGTDGDASYMELSGSSVDAGIKLIDLKRKTILETAQCIIADPNQIAAQGTSSVAIKAIYSPMLAKADVLREQYGTAIERILEDVLKVAKKSVGKTVRIIDASTGEATDATLVLQLPPKVEVVPKLDETGMPMLDEAGKAMEETVKTERVPGEGGDINLRWPAYFSPTYDDQTKVITSMTMATGGKQVLSKETAMEMVASALGVNLADEAKRMEAEGQKSAAAVGDMTPPTGGEVSDLDEAPPGALLRAQKAKMGGSQGLIPETPPEGAEEP